ncbi:flagellar assembly protein FliW [Caldisalinibacter kiritimatiensis]|uniref:Flagellar assembly factor FliW n=1 Tax=Caldisalinibacter kiritimatiensis TaxID=1304284 RepID=R1CNU3_9FIRM|nr:flagellar assembly protein FliW [Caldisalinibacter kiritimatiensis]EOD00371.1 Flagellar assembly factor FliW [Caldisalinibacter kiritimatiensis]
MKLNTKHFGEIEIDENRIITFPDGLLAFENNKKFIIIDNPDQEIPFQWLQSIDDPDLAFVIINPFIFKKDYEFDIPKAVVKKLEIQEEKDVAVYSIVVVPDDITKMTANLSGPVIINTKSKIGKQIVLEDSRYSTKHYILEELKQGQVE